MGLQCVKFFCPKIGFVNLLTNFKSGFILFSQALMTDCPRWSLQLRTQQWNASTSSRGWAFKGIFGLRNSLNYECSLDMWNTDLKFVATVTTIGCANIFQLCKFSREQHISLPNLRTNMNFSHEFGMFSHLFFQNYLNITSSFCFEQKRTKSFILKFMLFYCYQK